MNNLDNFDKSVFEDIYDKIKAPEELKTDTLQKMLDENEKRKPGKNRAFLFRSAALTAVLCAAVICFVLIHPTGPSYITPVEEGTYYDKVELKDGVIHFVKNRVVISVSPNAGTVTIGQEKQDGAEKNDKEEFPATEKIETESGGVISFQRTGALSFPEIAEDSWSYIGEQKIYVTVLNTENIRYQAAYEKDGFAYEMTGTNVTQKEFIDELYRKVTG